MNKKITTKEEAKKLAIKSVKSLNFVEHIEEHLDEDEEVICKICGKTVNEIWEEVKAEAE